jgi:CRISPR/Cas system-associated endonuclease Cas1
VLKTEDCSANRKEKRQYLSKPLAKDMMKELNSFFESTVEVPRIKHGSRQTVETLINEEALLLATYLRNEKQSWKPRIPDNLSCRSFLPLDAHDNLDYV